MDRTGGGVSGLKEVLSLRVDFYTGVSQTSGSRSQKKTKKKKLNVLLCSDLTTLYLQHNINMIKNVF